MQTCKLIHGLQCHSYPLGVLVRVPAYLPGKVVKDGSSLWALYTYVRDLDEAPCSCFLSGLVLIITAMCRVNQRMEVLFLPFFLALPSK